MITAQNLTKTFEGAVALDDLSFAIRNGSIFGLVGSNGSGKSTLLRSVAGIYRPDGGSVGIDGVPSFDNPAVKEKIAFLGDTPYFLPQSNLNDMAAFYAALYPKFDKAVFERLLKVFPVARKSHISTFSKGMQRQAALILQLSTHPEYLLLDEAFDGLDVVMRRVLANLLMEGVEQNGITTVIASHNLRELDDLSDTVGLLHEGKLLFNDRTDHLKEKLHKVQLAFERVPDTAVFDGLNTLKIERSGSILQLIVRGDETEIMAFVEKLDPVFSECIEPTLEEMFLYELEVTGYDVKNILE